MEKMTFSQNVDSLCFFTDQNHFFAEHQHGPYGPWEPFLQCGFGNLGRKVGVMEEK